MENLEALGRLTARIPIGQILPSDVNPRSKTHSDKAELETLTANVKEQGVLQAIMVRPAGKNKWKIVYGSRRFEAAKAAGLEDVPCEIRELTDDEARELALIENIERANMHYLDEAKGFAELSKSKTLDQIADKTGKKKAYIAQRLSLAALISEWVEVAAAGKLAVGGALHLARLSPELQLETLKVLKDSWRRDETAEYTQGEIDGHVNENFKIDLSLRRFDLADPDLNKKAGPCTICPKATGSEGQLLFEDLGKKNLCTDGVCYRTKILAEFFKLKEVGFLALCDNPYQLSKSDQALFKEYKPFVAKEFEYGGEGRPPYAECKGVKECDTSVAGVVLVGKDLGKKLIVCTDVKCPVHFGADSETAHGSSGPRKPGTMDEARKKQQEELWKRRRARAHRVALHVAVTKEEGSYKSITDFPLEVLRFMVAECAGHCRVGMDGAKHLAEIFQNGKVPYREDIAKGTDNPVVLLARLMNVLVADDVGTKYYGGKIIERLAKAHGINFKEATAAAVAEVDEKKKLAYERRAKRLQAERDKAAGKKQSRAKKAVPAKKAKKADAGEKAKKE